MTPHPTNNQAPPAGFLRRAAATLIDAAIGLVAAFLILLVLLTLGISEAISAGVVYILLIAYYPYGWSRFSEGQTFGKRALDVEVVDRNGKFISLWRAIGRYLAVTLSAIPLGLGFWWAIWDRQNQTWHDKIAGTFVRRVDYAPGASAAKPAPPRPSSPRKECPRCGESIAVSARVCRYCGLELGEEWAE
jgi:uncharacterized RDD family membrane protein YckC